MLSHDKVGAAGFVLIPGRIAVQAAIEHVNIQQQCVHVISLCRPNHESALDIKLSLFGFKS